MIEDFKQMFILAIDNIASWETSEGIGNGNTGAIFDIARKYLTEDEIISLIDEWWDSEWLMRWYLRNYRNDK